MMFDAIPISTIGTISNVPEHTPDQEAYMEINAYFRIKHSWEEQAVAYQKSCEINTP